MLNKQKGNMYSFVTHTWNPIRGKCPHNCSYCYMKHFWKRENSSKQVLIVKELKTNLGSGNFIFVGSSTDMFAEEVPTTWIKDVLKYCNLYNNKYLFQTKNPERFREFLNDFPEKTILGTTLESDRNFNITKAPSPKKRINAMIRLRKYRCGLMLSIEPILSFNLEPFVEAIKQINPEFVSIGADSKQHRLIEPSKEKVEELIKELRKFTEVKIKDNLKRLQ